MSLILDGTTGITPLVNSGFLGSNFRLTLTSGTPVTTSDVTGATTIYCTPYNGNRIALYDGTNWQLRASAEFSLALGTLTSGKPYDVFCYDNAGTPTLEFLVWTNDTTRATALVYQDGVLSKTGALTRRYMGTFYTTATTTTEDSAANRYLWNYYNRVMRKMYRKDTTATWSYTLTAYRQANASTSNQLNYVAGVAEDSVFAAVVSVGSQGTNGYVIGAGIGEDSTSTNTADTNTTVRVTAAGAGENIQCFATLTATPKLGRRYLAWLERGDTGSTATMLGSGSANGTGITGSLLA